MWYIASSIPPPPGRHFPRVPLVLGGGRGAVLRGLRRVRRQSRVGAHPHQEGRQELLLQPAGEELLNGV